MSRPNPTRGRPVAGSLRVRVLWPVLAACLAPALVPLLLLRADSPAVLARVAILAGLIAIGAAVVADRWFAHGVLRPLEVLAAAARRRRGGDRAARARLSGDDEIARLGVQLDAAHDELDAVVSGLQRRHLAFDEAAAVAISDRHGRLTHVNDGFVRLSGHSRDEIVDRALDLIDTRHHSPEFVAQMRAQVLAGSAWRGELRLRVSDGSTRWVAATVIPMFDAHGEPESFTSIYFDVTARHRGEEALIAAEARTRQIVETALDAVVTMDLQGRITGWNGQAERMFGWPAAEVTGRPLSEVIVPPQFRRAHEQGLERFRRTGEGHVLGQRLEFSALRRDGEEFPVELSISALHQEGEVSFSAFLRDIGDRRRAESELIRAKEAAQSASRAKTEFLATMSHEIRTPMNGVIGFADLLLETGLDATQREYADTIRSSGLALLALINDILDFSKIEAGRLDVERAPFDAHRAAAEVIELLGAKAEERRLELVFDWAPDAPHHILGDAMRFRQVLLNLAGNAIKFTESGVISVKVQAEAGERLRVQVRDTGVGIAEDKLASLFRKFTQADSSTTRRFGGTGLGLAISKQLVELMGGAIGVESQPGQGSTFWFTLPLPAEPVDVEPPPDLTLVAGMRVLVVDDLETNRRILRAQLAHWGIETEAAADAAEAMALLHAAARAGRPFAAALLDLQMPDLDGEELGRRILAERGIGNPALVLLTSASYRSESAYFRAMGFREVLSKPLVRPEQLLETLARVAGDGRARASRDAGGGTAAASGRPRLIAGARVLLVEDQAVNQKLVLRVLRNSGCFVDVATDGRQGCELAAHKRYDVIFMDCHMPEMDGFEAARAIRALELEERATRGRERHVPIVALTASVLQEDRDRCAASGMDDFLSKPCRPEQLLAAVERWAGVEDDRSEDASREAA